MSIEITDDEYVLMVFCIQMALEQLDKGIKRERQHGTATAIAEESFKKTIELHRRLVEIGRDHGIVRKPS
ncbi:MAG: hypothetical protein U0Q18_33755 [Bryobacteraceae bacterium]